MFTLEQKGEICKRFHLRDGQFFADIQHKNLEWYLNDQRFGFGDLRESDIHLIHMTLGPGEVFKGFNEHHMTRWMQCENPIIEINSVEVLHPERVPVSQATWDKIRAENL